MPSCWLVSGSSAWLYVEGNNAKTFPAAGGGRDSTCVSIKRCHRHADETHRGPSANPKLADFEQLGAHASAGVGGDRCSAKLIASIQSKARALWWTYQSLKAFSNLNTSPNAPICAGMLSLTFDLECLPS